MSDDEVYHPHETILSEAALETLVTFGEERPVGPGDVVYRAGEPSADVFVVVDGTVELVHHGLDGDVVVASFFSGECLGELNLVTGQRACLTARVAEPGTVLSIRRDSFPRMMSTRPELAARVAAAVGEGSSAVRSAYEYLSTRTDDAVSGPRPN